MKIKTKQVKIDNYSIFYREAGEHNSDTILMLHGFPSSSYMYSGIMEELAEHFHIIAPDYLGFGLSDMPSTRDFEYTFDNVAIIMNQFIDALKLDSFYLMVQDYGGPIGFRIAVKRPNLIKGLIVQNANSYMEGLGEWVMKIGNYQNSNDMKGLTEFKDFLLSFKGLKEQHLGGASNADKIDPSYYLMDNAFLSRTGAKEIQTAMFSDYGSNFSEYSTWQDYFRTYQPKTLIVWGINDRYFNKHGGEAYANDLKDIEIHFYNGGHFLLNEYASEVAEKIINFIGLKGEWKN